MTRGWFYCRLIEWIRKWRNRGRWCFCENGAVFGSELRDFGW